jgi:iron complex outermembrane receptor protein
MLGRWTHDFSASSALSIQTYYDYYEQKGPVFSQRLHTFDLDAQHNFDLGERQTITWGAGFRATWDTIYARSIVSTPNRPQANDQLANIFVQDEIALVRDKLAMTLGVKMEHNGYTGWECSPTARLLWHPSERQTVWGAVSRAVATPNHSTTGANYNLRVMPPGVLVQIHGQSDRVEELIAYEIGYRIQPIDRVSLDITGFYNDYANLLALEKGTPVPGRPPILPINWVNDGPGHTYGVELALGWQPMDHWQLKCGYTWFESDGVHASAGRDDGGASPEHQFNVRSTVDLGAHWEWDTGFRFVGKLESIDVPAYVEMDMRLAWKPDKHWELALVGQNLLQDSHFEYPRGLNPLKSEVPRSVYATVTARF